MSENSKANCNAKIYSVQGEPFIDLIGPDTAHAINNPKIGDRVTFTGLLRGLYEFDGKGWRLVEGPKDEQQN